MLMEKYELEINDVTKYFIIHKDKNLTLKQKLLFSKRDVKKKCLVLDKINLKVKKGELILLIGSNGSGKSTLLKLIAKILYPNSGKIINDKKICSIIELCAGFHQDFTGRENIYFNASIYGLSKKAIEAKIDEIINFSELGSFIDVPIRTYSSGMLIRLAFSIVINIDADIYLFDEIFAVGDYHFQQKCLAKIEELKKKKKTIIAVSHDIDLIKRLASRTIWLKYGKIYRDGKPEKILKEYLMESDKDEGIDWL